MKAKLWCRRWWCWLTTSRVTSKKWVEPTQNMTHVWICLTHSQGASWRWRKASPRPCWEQHCQTQPRSGPWSRSRAPCNTGTACFVFLYFSVFGFSSTCVSVFFQDCEGAWIRVWYKKMTEQHTLNKLKLKTLIEWMILNRCEINRKEKHIIFLNSLSCPPKCYKWHCHYQIVWAMSFVVKKKDLDFM